MVSTQIIEDNLLFFPITGNTHGLEPGPGGCSVGFPRKGSRAHWSPRGVLHGFQCIGKSKVGSTRRGRKKTGWDVPAIRGSPEDGGIEYIQLIIDVSHFCKYFDSRALMSV